MIGSRRCHAGRIAGISSGIKVETEGAIPARAGPASGMFPCVRIRRETKSIKVRAPPAGGICTPAERLCWCSSSPLGRQEREDLCGMKFFGHRGAGEAGLSKSSIHNRQGGDGPVLP